MLKKSFLIFMGLFLLTSTLYSAKYFELKEVLKKIIPASQKVFQNKVELTKEQSDYLNKTWDGRYIKGDKFTIYYSKDEKTNVSCYAVEMAEILEKYKSYHRFLIAFDAARKIKQVFIMELQDDHAILINVPVFYNQFTNRDPTTNFLLYPDAAKVKSPLY